MIKILFVCLGNICRSPMAEFVFKDLVEKRGISNQFIINSAATSNEETGNGIYPETRKKLEQNGLKYTEHKSRQITKQDYSEYDYIIGMENSNKKNILKIVGEDKQNKVHKLLEFTENPRDIADPWYTRNFDIAYDQIKEGCEAFLDYCIKNN